jgi:hypothetical protein
MSTGNQFAVCIRNSNSEDSLELRKIYEILDDPAARAHHMIRVIDEEEEDYLYPESCFLPIVLPHEIEEAILELTHS